MSDNKNNLSVNGWLKVIESTPPKFHCPITEQRLMGPCQNRGCVLWSYHPPLYSCAGAFASAKAANAEERLKQTSSSRDKRGTLRQAAEGKLSFYDLAHFFALSRQRVEGYVSTGKAMNEVLEPIFHAPKNTAATRRIGSTMSFTHVTPVKTATRICVCCESKIEADDPGMVLALLDRSEVSWCSRECVDEFPLDAYLVSCRYKRHWTDVALAKETIDERSRVREVTPDRMEALRLLATEQGYA